MTCKDRNIEVVISGMSGRFPGANNLDEFWEKLINGEDMISETHTRYNSRTFGLPSRIGIVKDLDKFDAEFFGVHKKQAGAMDPRMRKSLEVTFEAIFDSGTNPSSLRGSKTGVFFAGCGGEAISIKFRNSTVANGYNLLGGDCAMLAGRISYAFDFSGPSYVVDTACSSGSVALYHALLSIRNCLCDSAVVIGCQAIMDYLMASNIANLNMTSPDGKCKTFDDAADGYARSEAFVALYLCRQREAKRSYATILYAAVNNDGFKDAGITHPSQNGQEQVMRQVYTEAGISPLDVNYVEAHGTGTSIGDQVEIAAIAEVFCRGRDAPLLVGAVKSNMGHSEYASGLCGIVKVLLCHAKGIIPPNLHYKTPNTNIPALVDGRIKVVDKPTTANLNYVGINCAGFSGTNAHVLLKMSPKTTSVSKRLISPSLPKLIMCSGRTKYAVEYFLIKAQNKTKNRKFVELVHSVFATNIPRHDFRGYQLLTESEELTNECAEIEERRNEMWFIFTGVGCQWIGMSRDLVNFTTFLTSMENSIQILAYNGFNARCIFDNNSNGPSIFSDVRNIYVSITIMQIALVDLLESIGIRPSFIIGHSAGEVGASYSDGCLSQEQSLLVALGRATGLMNSNLPPGALATIGLSWEEATKRCPKGVYPAIHNSKENVTVAGTPDILNIFLEELNQENIFTKIIPTAGFGFHSPLVAGAENLMTQLLKDVIPNPKERSAKWLSSSVPENLWGTYLGKYCSAEYHVYNGLNPVNFYSALLHIPESSLVLEIAPHCLLQTILQQVLPTSAVRLGLVHCKASDNCKYLLNSLGKCYVAGVNMNIGTIYDPGHFQDSSPSSNLSSLLCWKHDESWEIPKSKDEISRHLGFKHTFNIQLEDSFLEGHSLDDKVVLPATGYIWLAWKYYAVSQELNFEDTPVVMEDLRFEKMSLLSHKDHTDLLIRFFPTTGTFQINEGNDVCCSGKIRHANMEPFKEMISSGEDQNFDINQFHMTKDDFYQEFRLRGYGHSGHFEACTKADLEGRWAQVEWTGYWICFLDCLMHSFNHRMFGMNLHIPVRLDKFTFYPNMVRKVISQNKGLVYVQRSEELDAIYCSGVEMRGISTTILHRRSKDKSPTLFEQVFVPLVEEKFSKTSKEYIVDACLQIVIENTFGSNMTLTEILSNKDNHIAQAKSQSVFYGKTLDCCLIHRTNETMNDLRCQLTNINFLTNNDFLHFDNLEKCCDYQSMVKYGGFVLYEGFERPTIDDPFLLILSREIYCEDNISYVMLARKLFAKTWSKSFISLDGADFHWVRSAQTALEEQATFDRIYFVATNPFSGIIGFIKCLVREVLTDKIRCFHMEGSPKFSQTIPSNQISKDLLINIMKGDRWGIYSHISGELLNSQPLAALTHAYADVLTSGDLSSLSWIDSPLKFSTDALINIAYAAINFKDVMLATGRITKSAFASLVDKQTVLGAEFSGTLEGRRVMGIGNYKCLATHVNPSDCTLFDIPECFTLEEGATIPVAYITAYYALICRGQMKPKDTVLIHSGSGAVGQAAIHVALEMNCTVFTTVSSDAKRDFVKSRFPQINDENIACSNDANNFERHVLKRTRGLGVRLVLNSLAADNLQASIRCLGPNGKFLEIGKQDVFSNTNIGMSVLAKGVSITGVYIDHLFTEGYEVELGIVSRKIQDGLSSGKIRPLTFSVFENDQLEDAFRSMAQRKHIGKVIVKMMDAKKANVYGISKTLFENQKAYLIIGGLGGMGFELANWMVDRGARILVITSRSGKISAYHEYRFHLWRRDGVLFKIYKSDLSTAESTIEFLCYAKQLGEIGGIFNVAAVLKDASFEDQTNVSFDDCAKCKVNTTTFLDLHSRSLAPNLKYFVVFSSITSARGFPGQTNYGYANSVMERICENRAEEGLPALAIQWGAVEDVGVFHRLYRNRKVNLPISTQRIQSCLQTLDRLMQQPIPVVLSFVPSNISVSDISQKPTSLRDHLASILGIKDLSKVDKNTTLGDLGLDSLMLTEFAKVVAGRAKIDLPKSEIHKITFEMLSQLDLMKI